MKKWIVFFFIGFFLLSCTKKMSRNNPLDPMYDGNIFVEGQVSDLLGNPVERYYMRIGSDLDGNWWENSSSEMSNISSDGTFSAILIPGPYDLSIEKGSWDWQSPGMSYAYKFDVAVSNGMERLAFVCGPMMISPYGCDYVSSTTPDFFWKAYPGAAYYKLTYKAYFRADFTLIDGSDYTN